MALRGSIIMVLKEKLILEHFLLTWFSFMLMSWNEVIVFFLSYLAWRWKTHAVTMLAVSGVFPWFLLVDCLPSPSSKEKRVREVEQVIRNKKEHFLSTGESASFSFSVCCRSLWIQWRTHIQLRWFLWKSLVGLFFFSVKNTPFNLTAIRGFGQNLPGSNDK